MLRLTALILLFIGGLQGYGQDWKGYYQAEIGGGVTADRLLQKREMDLALHRRSRYVRFPSDLIYLRSF